MNGFPARFRDFDHVCALYRSRYRNQLLRSRKKFELSGLRVVHLRGGMGVEKLYTEDVHRLYLAVLNRAEVKLECLPAEFFRELARQFRDDAALTLIYQDQRIVAFMCGIFHQDAYLNLFCGFDYDLNDETDLYFNLMYEDLDYALRQKVQSIHVGQTANDFKLRMGCFLEPRCFYVKARLSALQPLLRAGSPHLFPARTPCCRAQPVPRSFRRLTKRVSRKGARRERKTKTRGDVVCPSVFLCALLRLCVRLFIPPQPTGCLSARCVPIDLRMMLSTV